MRIATPSSCRTCTDYSLPVSPAHSKDFGHYPHQSFRAYDSYEDAWLWWEETAVAYRQAVQGLDYEGYLKYVAAKRGKFKSNIVRCQTRFDTNETRWQVRKPRCNASA